MVFRIAGGIGIMLLGLTMVGVPIPTLFVGITLLLGGVALLAGI